MWRRRKRPMSFILIRRDGCPDRYEPWVVFFPKHFARPGGSTCNSERAYVSASANNPSISASISAASWKRTLSMCCVRGQIGMQSQIFGCLHGMIGVRYPWVFQSKMQADTACSTDHAGTFPHGPFPEERFPCCMPCVTIATDCPSAGARRLRPLDEWAGPSLFACLGFVTHSHVLGECKYFLSHTARCT